MNAFGAITALVATIIFNANFSEAFGLLILLEGAVLMLVGSAFSFAGSASTRKLVSIFAGQRKDATKEDQEKSQHSAFLYVVTGLVLFVEALLFAVLFM